ncbi:MAG: DUF4129 domain-containing protein [Cyanobacteria bacterium P01_G01_bin.54]
MNDEFAKDSWAWRLDLALRRLGEWWQALWQSNTPRFNSPNEAPSGWADFWRFLGDAIWFILILSLSIWGLWALWRLARPYWRLWQEARPVTATAQPSRQSPSQWQQQAQQYQRQGNYTQACLCLYFGMLQHLHDQGQVPHQASRTDGEYHRALAEQPHSTPYYTLLTVHQRLKFANAPATQELLDRCLAAYAQLS